MSLLYSSSLMRETCTPESTSVCVLTPFTDNIRNWSGTLPHMERQKTPFFLFHGLHDPHGSPSSSYCGLTALLLAILALGALARDVAHFATYEAAPLLPLPCLECTLLVTMHTHSLSLLLLMASTITVSSCSGPYSNADCSSLSASAASLSGFLMCAP